MENNFEFRGVEAYGSDWVYGFIVRFQNDDSTYVYYIQEDTTQHIRNVRQTNWEVKPETVGQFTGLRDSTRTKEHPNGKPIYVGDIIEKRGQFKNQVGTGKKVNSPYFSREVVSSSTGSFKKSVVKQENSHFGKLPSTPRGLTPAVIEKYYTVIGNIHQNPELIK